jgi:hypothetical protein
VVGDESPQEIQKYNSLTAIETYKKVECFQSSTNSGVSHSVDIESTAICPCAHDFLGRKLGQDAVELAARWLHGNREAVAGPLIPGLKSRFGLSNLQAISAAKRAHDLQHGERS